MSMTVDQAAARIRQLVNDDGTLGTARNEHLHQVNAVLAQFSAADVRQIIGKLSDADLREWASDANSGGLFGAQGLSSDERRDLFNTLAGQLDGPQLARLSTAFNGRDDTLQLANAVATRASADAKLAYVQQMAAGTTDGDSKTETPFLSGSSVTTWVDKDASAVSTVLTSLASTPRQFNAALSALSDDQLAAVVQAGEGTRITTSTSIMAPGQYTTSTSHDPAQLRALLDATAQAGTVDNKARLFQAATVALKDITSSNTLLTPNLTARDAAASVTAGMTRIMDSDTRGVVDRLNTEQAGGQALTTYLKQLISENPTANNDVIGRQIAQLQGAGVATNAVEFVQRSETAANGDLFYRNAQNLGYYAGSLQAAVNKIAGDDKTQAEILGNVFSTTLSAATTAITSLPVGGKIVSGLANGLSRELIRQISADVAAGRKDLRDALYELALPRAQAGADRARGPADPFFQGAANTVVINNQ
jgi:hypothetical protein